DGAGARGRLRVLAPPRLAAARALSLARRVLRRARAGRGSIVELDTGGGRADGGGARVRTARWRRAGACLRVSSVRGAARRDVRRGGGRRAGALVGVLVRGPARALARCGCADRRMRCVRRRIALAGCAVRGSRARRRTFLRCSRGGGDELIGGKRICVVMPAYNAAKTLRRTVAEIDRAIADDIILVDDA